MFAAAFFWLLGPDGPVVRVDLGAPPEAGAGWLQPVAVALLLLSLATVVLQRRRARALDIDGLSGLRAFTLGAAVGNALLDLGGMLTPDRPNAESIQDIEEEPVDDAQGDGRTPPRGPATPRTGGARGSPDDLATATELRSMDDSRPLEPGPQGGDRARVVPR